MTQRVALRPEWRAKPIALIGRGWRRARQSARAACCALIAAALLQACGGGGGQPAPGMVAPRDEQGFIGGVAADEPLAALIARDILAAGGTAADAAVALFFALTVTYPSTASVAGGGACLVYRPVRKADEVEVLEFPARASRAAREQGVDRPTAVPAAVPGMAALHARYGALRWERLLAPAEGLARFGFQASRAFARDLALAAEPLFVDDAARRLYASADGAPVGEGSRITPLELSGVLAQLRTKGAGELYVGGLAQRVVDAAVEAGGALSLDELREVRPEWRPAVGLDYENHRLYTAPAPSLGGLTALQQFAMLAEDERYKDAGAEERPHLLAEASARAWAARLGAAGEALEPAALERLMAGYDPARHQGPAAGLPARWPGENPAGSGFALVDRAGMAVSCVVTLNNLFGTGRLARGLGSFLAAAPRPESADPLTSFAPALLVNHNTSQVFFAGAASGGVAAPSALAAALRGHLIEGEQLEAALAAPRLHASAVPDQVFIELGLAGAAASLQARGHQVGEVPEIGRVNAIACPEGLPREPLSCVFATDPRANGLGIGGVF
jgi:gamma-glutamyltranspeptidase/glutathione hydrolase